MLSEGFLLPSSTHLKINLKMKKILLIFSLLFFSISMNSQVLITLLLGDKLNTGKIEFGLEIGYNWSTISGFEADKYSSTFNIGFYFDFLLKNQWYLNTGTLVKAKLGVDHLTQNDLDFLQADVYAEAGDYSQQINTFLVPALVKYKFKNHFYLEAGPQFGLMYNSWVEYNSTVDGKDGRIKEYNKDMIHRLDAGLMAGFGFQALKGKGMQYGIKYYYGLVDAFKEKSGTKNSSFFVKVNIPIGANKKDEKIED